MKTPQEHDVGEGSAMPDRAALIARLEDNLRQSQMGYTERFEHQAERFYRETGFMAPGKSVPLPMASEQQDERRNAAWDCWQEKQREQWRRDIRDCIAALGTPAPPPHSLGPRCNRLNTVLADISLAVVREAQTWRDLCCEPGGDIRFGRERYGAEQVETAAKKAIGQICRLECDSPSYPPSNDERRQCGCSQCLAEVASPAPRETPL